ncbi:uncharacterized protein LOC135087325 [Ostrinia nubilalis]|uniref:uncharacterized protein LOC135087325 n=1 Tax=Ostrinia nubilalis TaxID=29057 RepID=UPI0030822088
MTVLTKASNMVRNKQDSTINLPLVEPTNDAEVSCERPRPAPQKVWVYRTYCNMVVLCTTFFVLAVMLIGATAGLMYYSETIRSGPSMRYKGYCAVPLNLVKMRFPEMAETLMTLPFKPEREESADPEIERLVERFEVADTVEKITVLNGQHEVEFIHDFETNATGIVDEKRCFTMELDPEMVSSPDVLVFNIERGDLFDVMRARTNMHALVAPPHGMRITSLFAEKCDYKPTYKLRKGTGNVIRKRSVDEPPHDYVHFSGKHIQEIVIDNLNDIEAHEAMQASA